MRLAIAAAANPPTDAAVEAVGARTRHERDQEKPGNPPDPAVDEGVDPRPPVGDEDGVGDQVDGRCGGQKDEAHDEQGPVRQEGDTGGEGGSGKGVPEGQQGGERSDQQKSGGDQRVPVTRGGQVADKRGADAEQGYIGDKGCSGEQRGGTPHRSGDEDVRDQDPEDEPQTRLEPRVEKQPHGVAHHVVATEFFAPLPDPRCRLPTG